MKFLKIANEIFKNSEDKGESAIKMFREMLYAHSHGRLEDWFKSNKEKIKELVK